MREVNILENPRLVYMWNNGTAWSLGVQKLNINRLLALTEYAHLLTVSPLTKCLFKVALFLGGSLYVKQWDSLEFGAQ